MAAKGAFSISGNITGLPGGSIAIGPLGITINPAVSGSSLQSKDLASGDNTITVPTGAVAMIFVPPSANTQTITLKGNAGDTGVPLSKTLPQAIMLGASPVVILNAGNTVAGCELAFA